MSLTKRDIVTRLAAANNLKQADVFAVVQGTLDIIKEELLKGGNVELRNFGVFEVKIAKSRIGRNPNAPAKEVVIPERKVAKFRAGKEFRKALER